MKQRETISVQVLTLEQAKAQFPGCDTEDLLEMMEEEEPHSSDEEQYLRLVTFDGRLLAATYEIGHYGWCQWKASTGEWHDLVNLDTELYWRLTRANLEFVPPIAG